MIKKNTSYLILLLTLILTACNSESTSSTKVNINTTENDTEIQQTMESSPLLTSYLQENDFKLLIPLYSYPSESNIEWRKLLDYKLVYPDIQMTVIVKHDDENFTQRDDNYYASISELQANGIKVIFYINARHSTIQETKGSIDAIHTSYYDAGLSGIFFDKVPSNETNLNYYTEVILYAKSKGLEFSVLNVSADSGDSKFYDGICDVLVIFEGSADELQKATLTKKYNLSSGTTLAILAYETHDSDLENILKKVEDTNCQYVYFTKTSSDNRWSYFSKFLSLLTPYSSVKFISTLLASKLQAPTSSLDRFFGTYYAEFEDVANRYFYLDENESINFTMCQDEDMGRRSELRFQELWKVSTTVEKTLEGRVKLLPLNQSREFTFMQIHSDGTLTYEPVINSPLIRLVWKKDYRDIQNHLWAVIKLDTIDGAKNYLKVDFGETPKDFFNVKISILNNRLNVWIDEDKKIDDFDVEYWADYSSYYKLGVYLQDIGCSHSIYSQIKQSL